MKLELLFDAKATLGEGPIWDARTQSLYWLDILNKRIFAGADILIELDEFVGCIAPRKNGGLILALSGVASGTSRVDEGRFSFASLELDPVRSVVLQPLTTEPANNRFNDGKCDPRGRFLAGTMDMNETDPNGSLVSELKDKDGKPYTTTWFDMYRIANGKIVEHWDSALKGVVP